MFELQKAFDGYQKPHILIDGANLKGVLYLAGYQLDYAKLATLFNREAVPRSLRYYHAITGEFGDPAVRFLDFLDCNGYRTVRDRQKCIQDPETGDLVRKSGDMDGHIIADAVWFASRPEVEHVVLMTHDSDFVPAVESMQLLGARVTVIGISGYFARELRQVADRCLALDTYPCFFRPKPKGPPATEPTSDDEEIVTVWPPTMAG